MIIFDFNSYGINLTVIGITCFAFVGFLQCINIGLSNIRLIILQSVKDYVSIQIIYLCLVRLFGSGQGEAEFVIPTKSSSRQRFMSFQL